jgi:hypothetical protein
VDWRELARIGAPATQGAYRFSSGFVAALDAAFAAEEAFADLA